MRKYICTTGKYICAIGKNVNTGKCLGAIGTNVNTFKTFWFSNNKQGTCIYILFAFDNVHFRRCSNIVTITYKIICIPYFLKCLKWTLNMNSLGCP